MYIVLYSELYTIVCILYYILNYIPFYVYCIIFWIIYHLKIHQETRKFAYNTVVRAALAYGGAQVYTQRKQITDGCNILIGNVEKCATVRPLVFAPLLSAELVGFWGQNLVRPSTADNRGLTVYRILWIKNFITAYSIGIKIYWPLQHTDTVTTLSPL